MSCNVPPQISRRHNAAYLETVSYIQFNPAAELLQEKTLSRSHWGIMARQVVLENQVHMYVPYRGNFRYLGRREGKCLQMFNKVGRHKYSKQYSLSKVTLCKQPTLQLQMYGARDVSSKMCVKQFEPTINLQVSKEKGFKTKMSFVNFPISAINFKGLLLVMSKLCQYLPGNKLLNDLFLNRQFINNRI